MATPFFVQNPCAYLLLITKNNKQMKKKKFYFSAMTIVIVALLSICFVSCGGDDSGSSSGGKDPTPAASIKVNGSSSTDLTFSGNFDGKSGIDYKQSVAVVSTTQWSISKDADWISVSPSNGNGSVEMVIYPTSENPSASPRTATITLSGSEVSATIRVTQSAGVDADLFVSPNEIVTLSEGFAFDFTFGPKVKYYYVGKYLPSALARKTDAEIISEMASDPSNRDTPSDGYVTSWQGQSPSTEYVICTVGYDSNGKHGALTKTSITTKSGTNQAAAYISDVTCDNTYWYWNTTVNGYVTKYYMWFITSTNLYSTTDATIAWFFKRAINESPNNFAPIAQGSSWNAARNGSSTFHVATWALDVNGNYSGVIDRFRGSVSSSSSKKMSKNYVEDFDSAKRYKTFK